MSYPKVICWKYYPSKKVKEEFTKEYIEVFYAQDEATKNAIEKIGFIPNLFLDEAFGIVVKTIQGYTINAKKHGLLKANYQKQYLELENKYKFKSLKQGCSFNDYVYAPGLDLEYFLGYHGDEILIEKLNNEFSFIKEILFYDFDFVNALLNFIPNESDGYGYYEKWQTVELKDFLKDLKIRNKEIYKELLNYDKVKELDKKLSCSDHRAKVKTLSKGLIQVNYPKFHYDTIAYWNGEIIEITLNDCKDFNKVIIEPTEDMLVTVIDENTINDNTIFIESYKGAVLTNKERKEKENG